MMSNLFSSFDPTTSLNLSLNWLSTLIGLFLIPQMFWLVPSRLQLLFNKIMLLIHKEFKILIKTSQSSTILFSSLFIMILMNNFLGLFPYIFTSTSHMAMTMSLALPLWISFMLYGWINNTTCMLAHLIPTGTPPILMPFMVCIETISNIIRPMTLAIRLAANMIAGHMIMTLLGNSGTNLSLIMLMIMILIQNLLLILESAVAIIQAYVFSILSTLYSSESN
uniref:ATP synthase subunit a n=1 Tax=Cucujoidea sp. 34 KM-2017 TaxID=2219372 RepID=A0A346RHR0_9CUCU|nr:ATP synthase F0 subunit 6 [Cucujoidea sp. 34 KM-2017]